MKRIPEILLFLGLALFYVATAQADKVYRSVDDKGVVEFSDQSSHDSEEVEVQKVPTYKFKKLERPATSTGQETAPAPRRQLQIVSPVNEETIRNNPGNMTVKLKLASMLQAGEVEAKEAEKAQPAAGSKQSQRAKALKQGEKIVLFMDDEILLETEQTTIDLKNIDRGTHHLKALVVGADGKPVLESPTVEFYMKRFSKLFKKPVKPVKVK